MKTLFLIIIMVYHDGSLGYDIQQNHVDLNIERCRKVVAPQFIYKYLNSGKVVDITTKCVIMIKPVEKKDKEENSVEQPSV